MKVYRIYVATNLLNKKVYVGQTSLSLQARINGHVYASRHGSMLHFHNAIRKNGLDVFEFRVINDNLSKDVANQIEKQTIIEFDSLNQGYNMTPGGDGVPLTPEIRQKMSDSRSGSKNHMFGKHSWNKGIPCADETRAKISVSVLKRRIRFKHTKEARLKMSRSRQRNFKHLIQFHNCVLSLRSQGMSYKDMISVVQKFNLSVTTKYLTGVVSAHKLQKCKTCLELSS